MQIKPTDTDYNGSTDLYTQGFERELNEILLDAFDKNLTNLSECRQKIEDVYVRYCKDVENEKYCEEIKRDIKAYKILSLKNLEGSE